MLQQFGLIPVFQIKNNKKVSIVTYYYENGGVNDTLRNSL